MAKSSVIIIKELPWSLLRRVKAAIRILSSSSDEEPLFQPTNEREKGQFVSIYIHETYRYLIK